MKFKFNHEGDTVGDSIGVSREEWKDFHDNKDVFKKAFEEIVKSLKAISKPSSSEEMNKFLNSDSELIEYLYKEIKKMSTEEITLSMFIAVSHARDHAFKKNPSINIIQGAPSNLPELLLKFLKRGKPGNDFCNDCTKRGDCKIKNGHDNDKCPNAPSTSKVQ